MTKQSNIKVGIQWMIDSYHLFKHAPIKWMTVALVYVAVFFILPAIPGITALIGLAVVLLWPACMAMVMGLYRAADQQKNITLITIFEEIKPKLGKLVALGATCLLYGLAVNWLTHDDVQTFQAVTSGEEPSMEMISQATPVFIKLLLLLTPMLMATWFAPMLIAFHGYSLVHAIKSSIAGCLYSVVSLGISWLYLTVVMALAMMLLGAVVALLSMLFPVLGQVIVMLILFNFLLISTAIMLGFQYVTYRDIFEKTIQNQ